MVHVIVTKKASRAHCNQSISEKVPTITWSYFSAIIALSEILNKTDEVCSNNMSTKNIVRSYDEREKLHSCIKTREKSKKWRKLTNIFAKRGWELVGESNGE